ncbi:MAG: hypothetical protein ACFCBV_00915 [Phycisphaerales bacterium]
MSQPGYDPTWMPDEATSRAFADAVAAFGERVDGLTPVSRDERVKPRWRRLSDPYRTPVVIESLVATQRMILDEVATPELLAPVLWCASAKQKRIRLNAPDLLGLLSKHFVLSQQCLVWLFGLRKWHSRDTAVQALERSHPQEMSTWILKQALMDRVKQVRWRATLKVDRCELRSLLPDMLSAAQAEPEGHFREWQLAMYHTCDKGVHVADGDSRHEVDLRYRIEDSSFLHPLLCTCSRKELAELGAQAVAEQAAREDLPIPVKVTRVPDRPRPTKHAWEFPAGHRPAVYSMLLQIEGPYLVEVLQNRHFARSQDS